VVRHGSARLTITINGQVYTLARFATACPAWRLTKQSPDGPITSYICGLNEHGQPACSCPDHQSHGAHCKHLGALTAAGLLAPPAPPAPAPSSPAEHTRRFFATWPTPLVAALTPAGRSRKVVA